MVCRGRQGANNQKRSRDDDNTLVKNVASEGRAFLNQQYLQTVGLADDCIVARRAKRDVG